MYFISCGKPLRLPKISPRRPPRIRSSSSSADISAPGFSWSTAGAAHDARSRTASAELICPPSENDGKKVARIVEHQLARRSQRLQVGALHQLGAIGFRDLN